jgi:hypothetical protein
MALDREFRFNGKHVARRTALATATHRHQPDGALEVQRLHKESHRYGSRASHSQ